MKSFILSTVFLLLAASGFATVVTVNASSTGTTTTTTKTPGTITVKNTTNRGYAVFDLSSASIPAAATITSVKLIFTYTISGASTPTDRIYGYVGDISSLSAAALYSGAVTANTLYTASWGTSATTKTMTSTATADTFIQHNHTNTISTTWVESASTRIYTITGGSSPQLQITYTCTTPSAVSITASTNPICSGSNETLTGHATGGTTYSWSGPNSFSSTALVPAAFTTSTASAGTYTFTATSACNISVSSTLAVSVKTAPGTTTGSSTVCVGSTTALSNAGIGGTWSASNAKATVVAGTGVVTGVTTGAVNITYTTGCSSAAVFAMTVITTPAAIGGASVVCVGSTTALTDATAGGAWTTSNAAVASVNASGTVTGVGAGSATISYTNACASVTKAMTVGIAPSAISGSSTICVGASATLTNTTAGGTWSSSATAKVTVDPSTGVITGRATGGAPVITYNTGCGTNATLAITVNASPAAIGGATSVCTGSTTTLTDATAGGAWTTSDATVASVTSAGVTRGMAQGTATISYTKTGCSAILAFTTKTTPASISGAANICVGTTTTLANTSLYGTWSTSNAAIASVDATGITTGVGAGSANISYTTGCGSAATKTETVITAPAAITGTTTVCSGSTTALADATGGGTWSSSNNTLASVSVGGSVLGRSQGTVTITYAISSCISTASVLVKTAPAAITGTTAICNGSTSTLANTSTLGTWSTSNAAVASIDATGLVTSVAQGSATITYSNGCGSDATAAVSIDLAPTALTGATTMCTGNTTNITESVANGTWSSSSSAVASVNTSGVVTALTAGSTTISYSLTNGCGANVVTSPMAVSQTGLWLGSSSVDWNDAANWPCGTIPDATINVTIPSGTSFLPDFSAATFSVNNLTINAGVTISISGDATVDVHGSLTNNGVANGDGDIAMQGGAAQTIYGKGTIYNMTINNTHGVSINSGDTVRIVTALTLTAGTFTTNSGIKLISNAAGTGRIAQITGGALSGNVNVEKYFE